MHTVAAADSLSYSPLSASERLNVDRLPVAPGSAQRFQMLMFAPTPAANAGVGATGAAGGLHHYVEALSRRWEAGQSAVMRMAGTGNFTSKELIQTQIQMINCALDVEVSSKCASMFENGVQTLIQRGS